MSKQAIKRGARSSSEMDYPLTQTDSNKKNKNSKKNNEAEEEEIESFSSSEISQTQRLEDTDMPELDSPNTPANIKMIETHTPDAPMKAVNHNNGTTIERTDDAEHNRKLFEEFNSVSEESTNTTNNAARAELADNEAENDALIAQAANQMETAEKTVPTVFAVAEEFDIANHNNLYFKNPRLEQASIKYVRSIAKTGKAYENMKVNFSDQTDYQQWDGKEQWNAAFITPPGLIELCNLPPFGNLSEIGGTWKNAPKLPSDCNASFNFTNKHFYLNSDRDQLEYDKRTRMLYAKAREEKVIEEYKKQNPTVKTKKEIPKEVYAFVQEGPLTKEQIATLPEAEKYSYGSKEVNGFLHFFKTRVEDVMQETVLEDPAVNCPALKNSVESWIKKDLNTRQEIENKAAEKANREPEELEPEDFDTVIRRSFRSKVKSEKCGGTRCMQFSKKLFRAAKDQEKEGLANGTIQCSNADITRICKENGLMEQSFDVYRFLSAAELANNPDANPLQKMSVAEAYTLLTVKNKGKIIGQVVFSASPLLVQGELGLYCGILGLVYWGPANAYREPRMLTRTERVPKPVVKKVFAPMPTVAQSTTVDVGDFATMKIPQMQKFEKKEEKKEESTKPIDVPA